MLEELLHLDKELFLFLNNLGTGRWDVFWLFMTNKWTWIPLYALLLFLAFRQLGPRKTVLLLIAIALLITCTDQLANFFKAGAQRLRPCYDPEVNELMRLVKPYCGGKFGYYSAHASNSFAIAIFFTRVLRSKFRYLPILIMTWAIMVSYSRVYIGVHFPLDILTGMGTGLIMGWLFSKLYIFALNKYHV